MVTNIDTNIGRVLKAFGDRGLASNTIVVFLTDNGPAFVRFNDGLRGWKEASTTAGSGCRVTFVGLDIFRPGTWSIGSRPISICADPAGCLRVAIAVRCQARRSKFVTALGGMPATGWPDRTLYFQWHRGDRPEPGRAFAARSQRYKLLRPEPPPGVRSLRLWSFTTWNMTLTSCTASPPRIRTLSNGSGPVISPGWRMSRRPAGLTPFASSWAARENPTVLTRQDWRGRVRHRGQRFGILGSHGAPDRPIRH